MVEAFEQLAPSQSRITLEPKAKALRVTPRASFSKKFPDISLRDEGFIESRGASARSFLASVGSFRCGVGCPRVSGSQRQEQKP